MCVGFSENPGRTPVRLRSSAATRVAPETPRPARGWRHAPAAPGRSPHGRRRNRRADGPPAGIVSVGGYRFGLRAMQELVGGIEDGSTLAALPDILAGHRLAGSGADREAICDALLAHGANPLLVAAFRARRARQNFAA